MKRLTALLWLLSLGFVTACGDVGDGPVEPTGPSPDEAYFEGNDLPLGELEMEDMKADGNWGFATQCKDIPDLASLQAPRIIISLNGLTLHLIDETTGFSKVYPIGVGEINHKTSERTANESLSYYPVLRTGSKEFTISTSQVNPCKIWWRDPETGQRLPVFAGLPFLSWWGNYGIHGPVTSYRMASGGRLKRGYVSHGCIRMEGADVAALWAYIRGVSQVPVRVQKEVERDRYGRAVDNDQRWILSECETDSDCNFSGGFCKYNRFTGRGFCTARCTAYCYYDKYGYPVTFCVTDPDEPDKGLCTYKSSDFNYRCRNLEGFDEAVNEPRFSQPWRSADVCLPSSLGWIGDACFADGDCMAGNFCQGANDDRPGFCTQSCSKYCPDLKGFAGTFCVAGLCRKQCDSEQTGGSGCPKNDQCSRQSRHNQSWVKRYVCMPE